LPQGAFAAASEAPGEQPAMKADTLAASQPAEAAAPAPAPVQGVLAVSTEQPVFGIGHAALMNSGSAALTVGHATPQAGRSASLVPNAATVAFIVTWLVLNGVVILLYRRRRDLMITRGEYLPVSLGAFTYRSATSSSLPGSGGF